jgi:hypothetical protein
MMKRLDRKSRDNRGNMPQTAAFRELLEIPNTFEISDAEATKRLKAGPRFEVSGWRGRGRGRGGGESSAPRGRGRGRGRARG